MGGVRSISLEIIGIRGCFSLLKYALNTVSQHITLTGTIKDQLKDFLWMDQDAKNCPTHIGEIVLTPPTNYGAANAAKTVMGGYGFHLETLNPSQFGHQLIVVSRHLVSGDIYLNPRSKHR